MWKRFPEINELFKTLLTPEEPEPFDDRHTKLTQPRTYPQSLVKKVSKKKMLTNCNQRKITSIFQFVNTSERKFLTIKLNLLNYASNYASIEDKDLPLSFSNDLNNKEHQCAIDLKISKQTVQDICTFVFFFLFNCFIIIIIIIIM